MQDEMFGLHSCKTTESRFILSEFLKHFPPYNVLLHLDLTVCFINCYSLCFSPAVSQLQNFIFAVCLS